MKETNSLGLACLYQDHIWKLHGLPNMMISDHGPQFALGFMRELNKILILGINTKIINCISPTNRWTDGENESGVGAIFEDVCGLLPNELAGVAGNC